MRNEGGPATLAVVETKMAAGEMPPLHVHDEDEAFYVVEGSLTIHIGGETRRLEAGGSALAPKGVPHTHRADSKRARCLVTTFVASAGRYEDFLRAVSRPVEAWTSGEEAATVTAIAAANGITVLGPPGALPAGR